MFKVEEIKYFLTSRVESLMFLFLSKMKSIFPLKMVKNKAHVVRLN